MRFWADQEMLRPQTSSEVLGPSPTVLRLVRQRGPEVSFKIVCSKESLHNESRHMQSASNGPMKDGRMRIWAAVRSAQDKSLRRLSSNSNPQFGVSQALEKRCSAKLGLPPPRTAEYKSLKAASGKRHDAHKL
jgi:hypothetical protein